MIALLLTLLVPAHAGDDPVLDAVVAEVERSAELRLPDNTPPHHVIARARSGWAGYANARMGALTWTSLSPVEDLAVEVRAGTPDFDSSGLGTRWLDTGFSRAGLPDVPTVRAVREVVWRELDEQYKAAVENLGRKTGAKDQLKLDDDREGNWQANIEPVTSITRRELIMPDVATLEAQVRALSARMRSQGLQDGNVSISSWDGHYYVITSDGTRIVQPSRSTTITMRVEIRADDDEVLGLTDVIAVADGDPMPSDAALAARVDLLMATAQAWAAAEPLDAPWYGPVLLEGEAAADFAEDSLSQEISGTPEPAEWQRWTQKARPEPVDYAEPGTRLLPRGWTVTDDPQRSLGHACCLAFDAEGAPSQPVRVIEDGVVVAHLMSRTPNEHFSETNGHARSTRDNNRSMARPSHVVVEPARAVSKAALWRTARKQAKAQGLDRVLVVRDRSGLAFWRTLDGDEIPVRGFDSDELDARAARGMTVAGPSSTHMMGQSTMYTVPDMLIANVAVVPDEPSPEPRTRRVSPLAGK